MAGCRGGSRCAIASRIKETLHSCHDSLIEFPRLRCIAAAPFGQKRYVSERELHFTQSISGENKT